MTYNLFIGADNKTHKVDFKTIYKTLDRHFDGYTVNHAVDVVCKSKHVARCIVTVSDDQTKIMNTVIELKRVLKQEAIGCQQVAELEYI